MRSLMSADAFSGVYGLGVPRLSSVSSGLVLRSSSPPAQVILQDHVLVGGRYSLNHTVSCKAGAWRLKIEGADEEEEG